MRTAIRALAAGLIILAIVLAAFASDLNAKNEKLNSEIKKMREKNIELKEKNKKLNKANEGLKKKVALAQKTRKAVKEWLSNPPINASSTFSGMASFYSYGARTATGEAFNPDGHTMAVMNRSLFGKKAKVTNLANGKSVIVKINDTGAFGKLGRVADLSRGAFAAIGSLSSGVIKVRVQIV